jgi:hypothetical protein
MDRQRMISCFAGVALATQAQAATVWNQPVDPSLPGYYSELEGQQIADQFTLTEQSAVTSLAWAGYYDSPQALSNPVSFTIRFYNDAGLSPDAPLGAPFQEYDVAVNAVPTGDIVAGYGGVNTPLFSYSVSLSPLTLDAGTYWLSILEADARSLYYHPNEWLWSRSDFSGDYVYRGSDAESWTSNGSDGNAAFTLNAVPVPAAFALFASGLVGLLGVTKRNRVWRA